MINLELPKKLKASANQAHQVAAQIFRPVSRKYDLAEHEYPVELDTMAAMVEALNDSGQGAAARHSAAKVRPRSPMAKMPTAETWPDSSTSSKLAGVTSD